jgi:hypothetical protein
MNALRALTLLALTIHAAPARVAEARSPDPSQTAQRRTAWFPTLAGKFRLEGVRENAGESGPGERMTIRGKADCRGIRDSASLYTSAFGVECFLDMTWEPQSGNASNAAHQATAQHSATLLYSTGRAVPGIMHMMVDEEGVAERGTAQVSDDILVSESPCTRIKGKCLRKMRITASDPQALKLEVDIELDGKRIGGEQITMHRETVTP